jgi:hypothetical protein
MEETEQPATEETERERARAEHKAQVHASIAEMLETEAGVLRRLGEL